MSVARRSMIAFVLAAGLLGLLPAAAVARPPVLTSVDAIDRQVTARWTLPQGVDSEFVQIATDPRVTEYGYFLQRHLVSFAPLSRHARSFRDSLRLEPGTYYVHVAGTDSSCFPDCPRIEFTDAFKVRIDPSGAGQGTNLALEGQPPSHLVYCRRKQSLRKLWVKARMDINGTLTAAGKVTVSSGGRGFAVAPVTRPAAADTTVKIPLQLPRAAQRAARRSLDAGRRARVRVTVTARDGIGRTASRAISVRLTR